MVRACVWFLTGPRATIARRSPRVHQGRVTADGRGAEEAVTELVGEQATVPDDRRDDRVLGTTRILAVVIVPFLLVAFGILFLRTSETGTLFAWEIAAPMSAMMLGTAYLGGAWFFARAAIARRWHHVTVGFIPVTAFATFMLVATLLHWDRFNQGHVSFSTWVLLYVTTPVLVLLAWLRDRSTDPGTLEDRDLRFPRGIRIAVAGGGAFYVAVALLLLVSPDPMTGVWPWPLTPLTARVIGGMLMLLGTFGLTIAADGRWSASRIPLQSLVIALGAGLLGAARSWETFDPGRPFTWIYLGTLVGLLVAVPVGYWWVERRLGREAVLAVTG
jgi:hypothetical protein